MATPAQAPILTRTENTNKENRLTLREIFKEIVPHFHDFESNQIKQIAELKDVNDHLDGLRKSMHILRKDMRGNRMGGVSSPLINKNKLQKTLPTKKQDKSGLSKKGDPLTSLKNSIIKFSNVVSDKPDLSQLSRKDKKEFQKQRKNLIKDEQSSIKKLIESNRKALLSKGTLTDEDKKSLQELTNIEKNMKLFHVSQEKTNKVLGIELPAFLQKGLTSITEDISTALIGPFNLILKPIEDLFGFKLTDIFGKKDKDEFTKKGKKVKPRRSDILKSNPEIIWLFDQQKKGKMGKDGKPLQDDFGLEDLTGLGLLLSTLKKFGPGFAKALTGLAGITMGLMDAFEAMGLAEVWGVGKIQAGIGGFLGGTGSGLSGALHNSIKGALIGFSLGGPAGALIGAAFGGALGAIGGENIAKGVQYITDVFSGKSPEEIVKGNDWSGLGEDPGKAMTTQAPGESLARRQLDFINANEALSEKWKAFRSENSELKLEERTSKFFQNVVQKDKDLNKRFGKTFPVQDAIIHPSGKIITPSPDDTIIATKSPVSRGFDTNMESDISQLSKSIETSFNGTEIVNAIKELISIVDKKPFNNIVQNNNNPMMNFDRLRTV